MSRLLFLVLLSTATSSGAQQWSHYGADAAATRYAPHDQIHAGNVENLEVAWIFRTDNFGPEPEIKGETTPIFIDGVLYATAGLTRSTVAIDAGSGELLWMYRLGEGERGAKAPRRFSGRGVAYWNDGDKDRRIYFVTIGYQLVALDASEGHPIGAFGVDGVVDLMRDVAGGVDPVGAIGSSSPPVIVGDVVIVGPAFHPGFRPPSQANSRGDVSGYDVRTGRRLWTFRTIPAPGEYGHETWEDGSWEYTGNAGVWAPFSADRERGYVYLPVEAPTSDFYGGHRPGDNLFSSSLVCLDARTGERVWHYQLTHHDIWDWDVPTAPILMDLVVGGRRIPAVVQLTKQSFAFVFDRVTGEPVWPIEERAVPGSDVPGERTAPTQPIPTKPPPFDRQGVSVDDLIDFTPELRAQAVEIVSSFRLGPLYQPPSLAEAPDGTRGTLMLPGAAGGAAWEAGAFDPETSILYVSSSTSPTLLSLVADPERSELRYIAGEMRVSGPRGLPLVKPPYGRITAIDLSTGEHRWMQPNGDTPAWIRDHPSLEGVDVGRTGSPSRAGILVTKTLVLAGEGWGGGRGLYAYEKRTGEVLARIELPGVQTGVPMSYLHEGRQYVVVSVGDPATKTPAQLVALALSRSD
ncbi:MAG TPA: PQQ-binding-like beta-propeller repeat protein [Vicinamibacteria bacterium]|nr:PQQ-binding-like beta-propeller repeat protein [Vicinamibacteria bacterium]